MKLRVFLLSTVSSFAITGAVSAADLPLKAAPIVAPNWAGAYIGVHGGVGRLNYSQLMVDENGNCGDRSGVTCTSSATGAVLGGQIGYNWQTQEYVYGIEADGSWTGLSHTQTFQNDARQTVTGKVDWLASIRGRAGLAVNKTLFYGTGGLAFAGLRSNWSACCNSGNTYTSNLNRAKAGWVVGFGIEHMFTQNLSARLEGLYYDFGRDSTTLTVTGSTYRTEFTHEIFVGRVGLNYKW